MYCLLIIYASVQLLVPGILTDDLAALLAKFHQSEYVLKLERAEVIRYDKNIFDFFEIRPFRYNKSSIIVLNVTVRSKVDLGHEAQAICQVYKFLSNEYRYFPIRFQVSLCDAMRTNIFGIGTVPCGNFTSCSLKKGVTYHMCNWIPDDKKSPPLIPTGRYKMELQMLVRDKDMALAEFYGEIKIPIKYK